jgi:hypothetical protein
MQPLASAFTCHCGIIIMPSGAPGMKGSGC